MKKGHSKASISAKTLRNRYVRHQETAQQIAESLGVSTWWVMLRLRKYGIPVRPPGGKFRFDIVGKRYGHYTVMHRCIGNDASATKKGIRWLCRCDCGNFKELTSYDLRHKRTTSCGKCRHHRAWKGAGDMSGQYFCALRGGAKRRKIAFSITKEQAWQQFVEQGGQCAITGLPLQFVKSYGKDSSLQTASIDRIDSNVGYVLGNIRWVHKVINIMRWHMTDDELLHWATKIVEGPLAKKRKTHT